MRRTLVMGMGVAWVGMGLGCGGDDADSGSSAGNWSTVLGPTTGAAAAGVAPSVAGVGGSAGAAGASGIQAPASGGSGGSAGALGSAGSAGSAGAQAAAGAGAGGRSGAGAGGSGSGGNGGNGGAAGGDEIGNFSFFVTSIEAMRELSGSQDGFGGDLGGLSGADMICQMIAAGEGAGHKTWRAFLSATTGGPGGGPAHAIDRIGEGPWYDRLGRLVAPNKQALLNQRPEGDLVLVQNLPNERGEPLNQNDADDHDVLTGSNQQGQLASNDEGDTCNDWTSDMGATGRPMCGHSWPARSGMHWIQAHPAPGCAPGVQLVQTGPPEEGDVSVGGGGGYGAFYCFALEP